MINFIKLRQFNVKLKATVQATGRLGFTSETAKVLDLAADKPIKFAMDDENPDVLYMVLIEQADEDSFKVLKSGEYLYLPTKLMFDSIGLDYKHLNVMFDLVRKPQLDEMLNGKVYQMAKRTTNRKETK